MHRVAHVLICVLTCGCAILSQQAPKSTNPAETPRCSESKGAVAVDTIFGIGFGVTSLAAFANDANELGALALALGGLYLGSALSGNNAANQCSKANEAHSLWLQSEHDRTVEPENTSASSSVADDGSDDGDDGDDDDDDDGDDDDSTASAPATAVRPAPEDPYADRPADNPPATTNNPPPATRRPPENTRKPPIPPPGKDDESWDDFWREVKP